MMTLMSNFGLHLAVCIFSYDIFFHSARWSTFLSHFFFARHGLTVDILVSTNVYNNTNITNIICLLFFFSMY